MTDRHALGRLWIGVLVLLALSLLLYGWCERSITGIPPMVADFARAHPNAEKLRFDAELARRFPIGSPDGGLHDEFRRLGRPSGCWNTLPKPGTVIPNCYGYASWSVKGCFGSISVSWETDTQHRLTALYGEFFQHCPVNAAKK